LERLLPVRLCSALETLPLPKFGPGSASRTFRAQVGQDALITAVRFMLPPPLRKAWESRCFGAPSRRSGTIHPYGYTIRRFSLRTPLPDSHWDIPVAQAECSDPQHVPGGGTRRYEDHSSRKRVATASVSVIASWPIGEYRQTRDKRIPKATKW